MFITPTNRGYTRDSQQKSQGKFLILCAPSFLDGDAKEFWGCVRYVKMVQCGHFMMGKVKVGSQQITLSGSYGGDGLPMDWAVIKPENRRFFRRLPEHLYEKWAHGGGWNSAGNEASSMAIWAERINWQADNKMSVEDCAEELVNCWSGGPGGDLLSLCQSLRVGSIPTEADLRWTHAMKVKDDLALSKAMREIVIQRSKKLPKYWLYCVAEVIKFLEHGYAPGLTKTFDQIHQLGCEAQVWENEINLHNPEIKYNGLKGNIQNQITGDLSDVQVMGGVGVAELAILKKHRSPNELLVPGLRFIR